MAVTLHTSCGDLKIELLCEDAPLSAYNFLALAASGYYDGTLFTRNIPRFIVQGGGDPSGTGRGGVSAYGIPFKDEFHGALTHSARGIVSMANKGRPDTNGSQFFITYGPAAHLNSRYTVFGRVIHGADEALARMEGLPVDGKDRPLTAIRLDSISIHANPFVDGPPPLEVLDFVEGGGGGTVGEASQDQSKTVQDGQEGDQGMQVGQQSNQEGQQSNQDGQKSNQEGQIGQESQTDQERNQKSQTDQERNQKSQTDQERNQKSQTGQERNQKSQTGQERNQKSQTDQVRNQKSQTGQESQFDQPDSLRD